MAGSVGADSDGADWDGSAVGETAETDSASDTITTFPGRGNMSVAEEMIKIWRGND